MLILSSIQTQVNSPIPSSNHPVQSDSSKHGSNTISKDPESGLHTECGDDQLHLNKVAGKLKWHITDGFKAWGTLRKEGIGQYPPSDQSSARRRQEAEKHLWLSNSVFEDDKIARCPFAAQQIAKLAARNPSVSSSSKDVMKCQDSAHLDKATEDPIVAEPHPAEARSAVPPSHTPSQAASTSKCPIRFLDQHSPEEVAEYFQNHRHEIPRSHEICVKRFQRSDDQIRQLDHKYGSLVNMIQGLGQKHQPMLHIRTDGEDLSLGRTSQENVEAWAHKVDEDGIVGADGLHGVAEDNVAIQRDVRFDRPLKDIRVGESPSRPWGISVPQAAHIPPSAQERPDMDVFQQPEPPTPSTAPLEQRRTKSPIELAEPTDRQPTMIFTGPVFMGYSPSQTAEIFQRTGLGKNKSQ